VYYRVGNTPDAEDLTQQVFLHAWRTVGSYQPTGAPFVAWLLAIAHNLVVSRYRRASRAGGPSQPLEDAWQVPSAGGTTEDPEAAALASADREAVRRAILDLKEEQQQVVLLRFVEGFACAEVAAALGKSEGNVRVIQHRALATLRRLLTEEEQVS
jgi:RNA polymerase sigma-70 factor, ECF subfamily